MRRTWLVVTCAAALGLVLGGAPGAESAAAPDTFAPLSAGVEILPSPAGPGSGEPYLVTAPGGKVLLSWLEPAPDSAFALRMASFDGVRWSAPTSIRTGRDFIVNWADFPSLEVFGTHGVAAHWLQKSSAAKYSYGVRVVLSKDGGATWGEPFIPHTDVSPTEHGFVAMWSETGSLGAAWLDGRQFDKSNPNPTNEMSVASTVISRDGTRGAESILDARACDCCQVGAAMTSEGPIVAYRDRSAGEIRDIAVVRRVRGEWTQPKLVNEDGWHIAACPVNGPQLSANGRNVALAWFTAARDTAKVNVAFSTDAGATFSAPVRVDMGAPAGRVDVNLDKDGSAIVTWIERLGGDAAAVQARRVRAGKAGAPITVASSSAARTSGFPRTTVSGDRLYFAWTDPTRPSTVKVARTPLSNIR